MEAVSDEEARSLASHWVKRIESSILGQIDESTSVVKASFKSDGDLDFAKQDSYGGEVNRCVSCRTTNGCSLNNKKSNVNGFLKERAHNHHNYKPEFEFTCSQSNSNNLKIVKEPDERMILRSQPLCSKRYTPRVDIDFIRQKRLAFFDVQHNPTRGSSDRVQLKTNSNVVHKQATKSKPTCDVHGVVTTEPYALYSPGNNFSLRHDSSDSELQWLKASLSPTLNAQCKGENRFFQQLYTSFGETKEEEDIRLELWGLKDAVNSGELDLQVYLQEPTRKGHQPIVGRPKQMLSRSFRERKQSHPEENGRQTFCMDLPVGELKNGDLFDEKSRSKAYQMSSSNSRNLQLTDASDQRLNSCGLTYQVHSSEHFNTSFSESQLEGNENINSCLQVPKPQIYGPLYSGFENSDSESSLLSFGSTCKEVNYRKVVKKREPSSNKKSSSPHEKHESRSADKKRGKEKILLELTHFIEGAESTRGDQGLNQTSSGILADKHIKENNTSFSAETLTNKSSVVVEGGGNTNTQGNCGVHLMNEPCITGGSLSSNYIELNGNDQSSEIFGKAMGKTCPECGELNSGAANWCIECGIALVSVKPSCLTSQQQKRWEEKHSQTQAIIKEMLKREDTAAEKQVKQLNNDISSLSLQASHSSTELGGLKHSSPSGYSRHWTRSSTAWSSFNPGELSKSSSCLVEQSKIKRKKKCIPTGAEEPMRARSASELPNGYTKDTADGNRRKTTWTKPARQRASSCNLSGSSAGEAFNSLEGGRKSKSRSHPQSTDYSSRCNFAEKNDITTAFAKRPSSATVQHQQTVQGFSGIPQGNSTGHQLKSSSSSLCVDEARQTTSLATKPFVPPLNLQDVDSYDRILTLIRTQRESEPVAYLYLPDEILLKIFSFMRQKDLSACSRVCWQFYRISMDESLWKAIVIKKNRNITDEWLCAIGKHRPVSLTMSQCHGNKVTTKGLRELFRSCSDTLEELNFSGCRGGELIGESILLHVAARCRWLRSVDASWSNVGDTGVQALVDNVESLQCLCLNGCPAVTDESIQCVANKHGTTLRIFEVFGCFNITPAGIKILGHSCRQLQTLNIGQCHKITDSAIGSLVSNLPALENLDLRGCKQVRDSAVKKIVRYCPLVINLVLANCPYITDVSLAEIATNIPKIRSLDICGCAKVSDNGIRALSKGCVRLELLDLTSTGVSHKSVHSLANYCSQSLCNLKLSFCSDISDHTVAHLARHCKRLTTLHLYGCKRIRNASALRSLNPALTIEC